MTASCLNSTGETTASSWSHESQQSTGCVIKEQMKKKVIHGPNSAPGVGTFSPLFSDHIFSATPTLHIADHNLPSGGSLDCVVKGANNSTATLLTLYVGRFELAL